MPASDPHHPFNDEWKFQRSMSRAYPGNSVGGNKPIDPEQPCFDCGVPFAAHPPVVPEPPYGERVHAPGCSQEWTCPCRRPVVPEPLDVERLHTMVGWTDYTLTSGDVHRLIEDWASIFAAQDQQPARTTTYIPTPDDLDQLCARISASAYASVAVEIVEDWTREHWGVQSAFTTQVRAESEP